MLPFVRKLNPFQHLVRPKVYSAVLLANLGFVTLLSSGYFSGPRILLKAESTAEATLDEKLKSTLPSLPKDAQLKTSSQGTLNLLIKPEDLSPLVNSKKISSCQTSDHSSLPDKKSFSNFGAACFKEQANQFYLTSDIALIKNDSILLRPSFEWNSTQAEDILDPIPERTLFRAAQILVSENRALSQLLQGRIQLEISPESFWESMGETAKIERRPQYIVVETESQVDASEKQLVASVGETFIPKRKTRLEKKLVEEIPGEDQGHEHLTPALEPPVKTRKRDFREQLGRTLQLNYRPLSKFSLKFNRVNDSKTTDVGARLSELNGLVYIEKSSVLNADPWGWGWRVPYARHYVSFQYSRFGGGSLRTYGYLINEANQLSLAYNGNDSSYLLSLKSNL